MKLMCKDKIEEYKNEAVNELNNFYNIMTENDTRGDYFKWISLKTKIISGEKTYNYPCEAIPSIINKYVFDYLYSEKQEVILRYYKFNSVSNQYILNCKKTNIIQEDKRIIVNSCVLKRGAVIWAEFGYNIDCEFGGRHPALILRNCKDSVVVIPLSSQEPNACTQKYSVKIDKVYNFPLKSRWTNIMRIQSISVQRIDFTKNCGSVSNVVLSNISDKISECGIK